MAFGPPVVPPLELLALDDELELLELLELDELELLEMLELDVLEVVAVDVPELLDDEELLDNEELLDSEELLDDELEVEAEDDELLETTPGQTQFPLTASQLRLAAVQTRSSPVQSAAVLQTWVSRSQ